MSPLPAAIANARSEFGAGSGLVLAARPPCSIGKTSQFVMPFIQQIEGHAGNPKTGVFNEFAADKLRIFDESGFGARKPCTAANYREVFKQKITKLSDFNQQRSRRQE